MSIIKLELPITAYPEAAEWSMGKFSEAPKFILEDFFSQTFKLSTINNNNRMVVIGGETTIVVYDIYNVMYLWIAKDISELDESEVPNLIESTHGIPFEENSKILIPIPFYAPDYYYHNNFFILVRNRELETAATSGLNIDSNTECYFRSDGEFHDFVRNRNADETGASNDYGILYTDYGKYVNVNKTWLYFGKIFSTSVNDMYWIEYKGIDRFSVAALPETNRKPKVESLFELFFDRVYNQAYNAQKNLSSLMDAWEIDLDFIEYLASHYSMTLEIGLTERRKREYVFNLINLLKRKGTYASMFIVFKSLFPDSLNNLIVYERWHERGLTGIPLLEFQDFNYLESYNMQPSGCAGDGYYGVVSQGGWNVPLNDGCHIHQQNDLQVRWVIPHNLNTQNPLIAVYDERLRSVSPKSIYNPEPYLTVLEFDAYVKGFALLAYPQLTLTYETSANSWNFNHALGQLTPVIQNYDTVNFSMIDLLKVAPQTEALTILQSNVLPDEVMTVAVSGDYIFEQQEPLTEWEIPHTLDSAGVIADFYVSHASSTWHIYHNLNTVNLLIQCFDNFYRWMRPENVTIVNANEIEITFDSKQQGFALIKEADYSQNIPSGTGTAFDITHNLGVYTPMSQAFNESGAETAMTRESVDNLNTIAVETWEAREFDYHVVNPSYIQKIPNKLGTWNIRHEMDNRNNIVQCWINEAGEQWEIPHEFGHRNIIYQCYDGDGKVIYPKEARIYDDKVMFIFNGITYGYVCLTEADETYVMDYSDEWSVIHTLDHLRAYDVILQTMEVSGTYDVHIMPDEVRLENNGNTIVTSFSQPLSGLAHIKVANYYAAFGNRTEWLVNHYLDEDGLITKCFAISGHYYHELIPDEVEMISSNVAKITWATPTSGFVVFTIADDIVMPVARAIPNQLTLTDENNILVTWYTAQRGYVTMIEADAMLKSFNKAVPKEFKINSYDRVTANFDMPVGGYAVLRNVGQLIYSAPLMMSPHYKVELDITCEPFDDNWIIDESTMTQLIRTWEVSKPVSRFAHYSILVSPVTDWDYPLADFTANHWHRMYPIGTNVNLYTKATTSTAAISADDYIYTNYAGGIIWNIEHTLNTVNLAVQCYDENGYLIIPKNIEVLSASRVLITFIEEQKGSALICQADFVETLLTEEASGMWTVDHRLGEKFVFAQNYYKQTQIFEAEVNPYTTTVLRTYFNEATYDGLALGSEMVERANFTGAYTGSTWTVNHNLGNRGVMVAVFGVDGALYYQAMPDEIHLVDDNQLVVTFSEAVTGNIVVVGIGGLFSRSGVIDSLSAGGYIKIGNGTSLTSYNPRTTNDLKAALSQSITPLVISEDTNYYYVTGEILMDQTEMDVTEIGLFTAEDVIVFYSMIQGELYKPSNVDFKVHYRLSKTSIAQ